MKKSYFLLILTMFLSSCFMTKKIDITVENTTELTRTNETVEIPLQTITELIGESESSYIVTDSNGEEIISQLTNDALLFQVSIPSLGNSSYRITKGEPKEYEQKAYGRLVPERKDDWAWENDKIAFRVYGPALEATGEISNGIDVWVKSTDELIIDKWYKPGVNYHKDNGEGLDFYKVGRTLGAGALAPVINDTLALGCNFVEATLIDSGAIRTTVQLKYAPYIYRGNRVTEQRVISLDAGSNFNKISSSFSIYKKKEIDVVAGINLLPGSEVRKSRNVVTCSTPESVENGVIYTAIIMPSTSMSDTIQNHIVLKKRILTDQPYTYYNGAGWSKGGFSSREEWEEEVSDQVIRIKNPLKITIL